MKELILATTLAIKQLTEYALYILFFSIVFNIVETIYFGCNMTAMSRGEEICDVISLLGVNLGLILALIKWVWFPVERK
jgi:cell division protein FtsX